MSNWADSNPQKSVCTNEQAFEQAYLIFQDFLPARSSSAQSQDSPSIPSSTPTLISSPRQGFDKICNLPCVLTLDFGRPTLYSSVTVTNPTSQLPPYSSYAIAQANRLVGNALHMSSGWGYVLKFEEQNKMASHILCIFCLVMCLQSVLGVSRVSYLPPKTKNTQKSIKSSKFTFGR